MNPFSNIGPSELLILLAIVLIIFGPKRLPGLGRAIGKSIKEFKEGMAGIGSALDEDEEPKAKASSTVGDLDPKPVAASSEVSSASSGKDPSSSS